MHIGVRSAWATLGLPARYRLQGTRYQVRLYSESLNCGSMKGLGKCVYLLLRRHGLIIKADA
jgi:hypothetical protein